MTTDDLLATLGAWGTASVEMLAFLLEVEEVEIEALLPSLLASGQVQDAGNQQYVRGAVSCVFLSQEG